MQIFKELFSEAWIGTVIAIGGIFFSFVISYYFYKKSQVDALLAFQMSSIRIITKDRAKSLNGLNITFKGKEVVQLTKTYIFLWNDGRKIINGVDCVPSDRLRISIIDAEILSTSIVKTSRDVNNISIDLNDSCSSEAFIIFDYLDPNDGVVIEILHTGKERFPQIKGVIKGIPKGILNYGIVKDFWGNYKKDSILWINSLIRKSTIIASAFLSLLLLVVGISYSKLPNWLTQSNPSRDRWFWIVMGIITMIVTIIASNINRKKFPKTLLLDNQD